MYIVQLLCMWMNMQAIFMQMLSKYSVAFAAAAARVCGE